MNMDLDKVKNPEFQEYAKFFNLSFNSFNPFMNFKYQEPTRLSIANVSLTNPMASNNQTHKGPDYKASMTLNYNLHTVLERYGSIRNKEELLDLEKIKELAVKNNYNFDKALFLEAHSAYQQYKLREESQTTPIKISLKSLDVAIPNDNEDLDRAGIDLICVIDVSGSMQGSKLELVQQTFKYMISLMKEYDRLALVIFNENAEILFPLKSLSKQNVEMFHSIINGIESRGGTCIAGGLQRALDIIKTRKDKNPVTSVFLLSDGKDSKQNPLESIKNVYGVEDIKKDYTVNTFGFGLDHDAELMREIAKMRGGNFYFVEDIKCIDACFIEQLGLLFSLILKDIEIMVKVISPLEITRTYGDMWEDGENKREKTIKLKLFASGMTKDYICEVMLPKRKLEVEEEKSKDSEMKGEDETNVRDLEESKVHKTKKIEIITDSKAQKERDLTSLNMENTVQKIQKFKQNNNVVVLVSMTGKSINERIITKESELVLNFVEPNETIDLKEMNEDVMANYLRVRTAEAIENAKNSASHGFYEKAHFMLLDARKELDAKEYKKYHSLSDLYEDLGRLITMFKENFHSDKSQLFMSSFSHNHMYQQSCPISKSGNMISSGSYSTSIQQAMNHKLNEKKKQVS